MAADTTAGELVLYGGEDTIRRNPGDPFATDTWVFRNCAWHRYSGAGPTLVLPSIATSPRNGGVLLFGLPGDGKMQTWIWSRDTWTQVVTASEQTPPGRYAAPMAPDPSTGEVALSAGFNQARPDFRTWLWNGAAWRVPELTQVPDTDRGLMAADASTGVVFAGESTWLYRNSSWTRVAGPDSVHQGGAAVDDPLRHQVLFVGGSVDGPDGLRIDAYGVDGWHLVSS